MARGEDARRNRGTRKVAAAGFGVVLTLPLAASAAAMPAPEPDGGVPATDTGAGTAAKQSASAGATVGKTPPARAPSPVREPVAKPKPTAVTPKPKAKAPTSKPAAAKPDPAPPVAQPPRTQVYGMDSFTYHHLPPDDQQSIRTSYENKQKPKATPKPDPRPAPKPVSAPTAVIDPKPAPKPDPKPVVAQPPRTQVYGMDSFTYHHLPPDDQDAIRASYEKKHPPKPAPAPPQPPAPTVAATTKTDPPAPLPKGPQVYGMDGFTYHHLPPDDQDAIRASYEKKHLPKPAPTPATTVTKTTKTDPPAPLPKGPQVYGMDGFTYHHLPPDDQDAIRSSYFKKRGLTEQGCRAMVGPVAPSQGRPCTFPDGTTIQIGKPAFTAQSGTTGMAIGPNQRQIDVVPFPGSVSVTCSQSTSEPDGGLCGFPKPGQKKPEGEKPKGPTFSVSSDQTVTSGRSDSTLDEDGTQRTTLDVTTQLKVTGTAGIDGKRVGVEGDVYDGKSSTYQVTVTTARAKALQDGDGQMPNPYDPRTLQVGDGIQLSKKDFQGSGGSISYEALKLGTDHETSSQVSAGVQRVDTTTARIIVGDKDSVKNALELGVGNDDVGVAISSSTEFGDGKLKSVDLDLSTKAGWAAYQRFVNGGEVPAVTRPDQPGVVDAATTDKADWAGGLSFDAHAGPVKISLGGTSIEGDVSEAKHPDGIVDNTLTARDGDVTMRSSETTEPGGVPGASSYSFSLKGVNKYELGYLTQMQTGNDVSYDGDTDASLSLTEADLRQIQQNALDSLAWGTKQARQEMSTDEIKKTLQDDPYATIPVIGGADGKAKMLVSAESPQQILAALYTASNGNPNVLTDVLVKNHALARLAKGKDAEKYAPGRLTVYR